MRDTTAIPRQLHLGNNEVHIWRAVLDVSPQAAAPFFADLSRDEQDRASRFYLERDRLRFAVGRSTLRRLLAAYLNTTASTIRFAYGQHGKPKLEGMREWLKFNVSHSEHLALYAFSRNREVGIDVERCRPQWMDGGVAEQIMSAHQLSEYRMLSASQRSDAFFRLWAQKEAYLKARGTGMSVSLKDFDVTLAPGEPARLLCHRSDPDQVGHWSFVDVRPEPGFVAILALETAPCKLVYHNPFQDCQDDAGAALTIC